jgi:glucan 1,3-beta-glucosidase
MSRSQNNNNNNNNNHNNNNKEEEEEKRWIRGVNVGGWLLAEQYITPYLFAINTCHLKGDLCWYPGQIGAPENAKICDPETCTPVQKFLQQDGNADYHPQNAESYVGYPMDEMTLGQSFDRKDIARNYMERHWDTFVTKQNMKDLKAAGVTHLRVPMGFWIRGDVRAGEPWIDGGWPYFVRFAKWCREIGLEIWADLHGAPGSQNGFDNSGYLIEPHTCKGWSDRAENVERTVDILTDIVNAIVEEGLHDVVTGVGLLNEPMLDCDEDVLRNYYNQGLDIVRNAMGKDTSVFVGDMFQSWRFNDGFWAEEENTFLDTHQYHVFFENGRAFTPRQHIAYLCRHNSQEVTACCYEDAPNNTIPTKGIRKIVGEWTGAYDSLPTGMAPYIMKTIAATGSAPLLNRTLSKARFEFIQNFVKAQMVVYEAKEDLVSSGWFFWNFKME